MSSCSKKLFLRAMSWRLVSKPKPGKFHPNSDVAGGGKADKQKTGEQLPPVVLEMSDFAD